jgi:hypothetical protein
MPAPVSTSSIVAQAFRFLERTPVSSLADDSEEATAAAEQYPVALRHVLERVDWSFASTRRTLSAAEDLYPDPVLPWLYLLPEDAVKVREVGDVGTRWRIDRDGLRSDAAAPLPVRYTGMIRDETSLPAMVQTALSLRLAWLLGPRFLETQSKIDGLDAQYRDTLKQAAREDARTASPGRYDGLPDQPDWAMEARW